MMVNKKRTGWHAERGLTVLSLGSFMQSSEIATWSDVSRHSAGRGGVLVSE